MACLGAHARAWGATPTPLPTVNYAAPRAGGVILQRNSFDPRLGPLRIGLNMPGPGLALVEVLNLRGKRVALLLENYRGAGAFTLIWDGSDGSGATLHADLYFIRANLAGTRSLRKLLLLNAE